MEDQPPGGYVLQSAAWLVCHAPIDKGPLGTLFIESRRHFLDFAEFSEEELASFTRTLRGTYDALHSLLHPQRIYLLSMMEGIPHFHAWIIPRLPEHSARGVEFLSTDLTCEHAEAEKLVLALRTRMNS